MRTQLVVTGLLALSQMAIAGTFGVGFQSSVAFDTSRKYDGKKGRPILLDVWYPSPASAEPGFAYERYFQLPDVVGHPEFRGRLEEYMRGQTTEDLGKSPEAFAKLLLRPTTAHLNAPYGDGRFPVVIYHAGAGGSFEENSVMFESLASNGFIVVSSAFESPRTKTVANNYDTGLSSQADLMYLASLVGTWAHADASHIAMMGHSMGAQYGMYWIGSPKCPAAALISLDTTLEYTAEDYPGHLSVRRALKKQKPPRIPVLIFASSERKPRFETWDSYLAGADRYEAAATGLHHDDYLAHGFLGRMLRDEPGSDAVQRGYEEVCRTILLFLNAALKGDLQARQELLTPVGTSPVTVRHLASGEKRN